MPQQLFSTEPSAPPIARVSWELGVPGVVLEYAGATVAAVRDLTELRGAGTVVTALDGSVLVLRLATTPTGDSFELTHRGTPLHASTVHADLASPAFSSPAFASPAFPSPAPADPSGIHAPDPAAPPAAAASAITEAATTLQRRMQSGRTWLVVTGIVVAIGGLILLLASSSAILDEVRRQSGQDVDAAMLRNAGVVAVVMAVAYVLIGRMAKGKRARRLFRIGASLTGLNFVLNLLQFLRSGGGGGLPAMIATVISGVTAYKVFDAYRAAREAESG